MFDLYRVRMEFKGRLCGSVPLSSDLIPKWLKSRAPSDKPEEGKPLEEIEKEVLSTVMEKEVFDGNLPEEEKAVALGFQMDNNEFAVRAGTLKAHIKDCALQLARAKVIKITAFRSKIVRSTLASLRSLETLEV